MENRFKMDDLGVPPFQETSIALLQICTLQTLRRMFPPPIRIATWTFDMQRDLCLGLALVDHKNKKPQKPEILTAQHPLKAPNPKPSKATPGYPIWCAA